MFLTDCSDSLYVGAQKGLTLPNFQTVYLSYINHPKSAYVLYKLIQFIYDSH